MTPMLAMIGALAWVSPALGARHLARSCTHVDGFAHRDLWAGRPLFPSFEAGWGRPWAGSEGRYPN
jgi:hypothetical protein